MSENQKNIDITVVTNNGSGASVFDKRRIALHGNRMRMLSEQQGCENFRLRYSDAEYASGFHVAGDPTLLVMLSGVLRIHLRSGEGKDFSAGEMFIAEDYLDPGVEFNDNLHGHSAESISNQALQVLHLKLNRR